MINNLELAELREKELKSFLKRNKLENLDNELDGDLILCVIEADKELGNIYAYRKGWNDGIKFIDN